MKLAAALNERADIQRRMNQLKTRLENNAKVQEGDAPAEEPSDLMRELDEMTEQLEKLVSAINRTNTYKTVDGKSISDLLAHRDCLAKKIKIIRDFLDEASQKFDRYSHTEVNIRSSVNVREIQKTADGLSAEIRKTDDIIQELNWNTELM